MKKINFLIVFLFISIVDCHISIVKNLIKDEKYKLKGTFTINFAQKQKRYLSIDSGKIIFSGKKQKFDIIESYNNTYHIISRYYKKFVGVSQKQKEKLALYDKLDNKNKELLSWEIIMYKSNLTKSGRVYTIKNIFNNKYLDSYFTKPRFSSIPKNSTFNIPKFRLLKLYQEEENIKQSNYDIVEKEPIDLCIKYIDLTDKNLTREGIPQITKDFDGGELRYSLRSILQYIPWIRKIFIVMPNDKVRFLKPYDKIKDKIVYVKDKDLLGYDTANIFAFTFNLHKMEKFGIAKNFIYMEDDFFIGKPLKKTDFFYYDEKEQKVLPFVVNTLFSEMNVKSRLALYHYLYGQKDKIKVHGHRGWVFSVVSTDKFFIEKYDERTNIINAEFTHNAFPVNIDDLKEIFNEIQDFRYINETLFSKIRNLFTLNQPQFHNLYQLNIKHRKVNSIPNLYINMENSNMKMLVFPLFVLNTCGDNIPSQKDYQHLKNIMKKRFPNSTKYEIENSEEENNDIIFEKNINKTNETIKKTKNKNNNGIKVIKKYITDKNDTLQYNIENKSEIIETNMKNKDETIQSSNNSNETKQIKEDNNNNKSSKDEINTDEIDEKELDNSNINIIKEYNYPLHGYILLGILLGLMLFIKFKNAYEFEY